MAEGNQDVPGVVYLLWHTDKYDDSKLLGVYRTEELADSAMSRFRDKPGFREPGGEFEIDKYKVNQDNWTEGFFWDGSYSLPQWIKTINSKE